MSIRRPVKIIGCLNCSFLRHALLVIVAIWGMVGEPVFTAQYNSCRNKLPSKPLNYTQMTVRNPPQPCQPETKTIYLIRHGEGFHNIGYDHNLDAHLTPRGWAQTAVLQQHLTALQEQIGVELVVVSPLRRALETAAGVFGSTTKPLHSTATPAAQTQGAIASTDASIADSSSSRGWVFMTQQVGRPSEATPSPVLYLPKGPQRAVLVAPDAGWEAAGVAGTSGTSAWQHSSGGVPGPLKLLAHEGCRDRIGPNVCDKFRDVNLQAADFPGVDFQLMPHASDVVREQVHDAPCLDGGCYQTGEEEAACERRALEFYRWLMTRPESVIAVVSHCGFLVHGMRALGKCMFQAWSDAMTVQCNLQSPSNLTASHATGPAIHSNGSNSTYSTNPAASSSTSGTVYQTNALKPAYNTAPSYNSSALPADGTGLNSCLPHTVAGHWQPNEPATVPGAAIPSTVPAASPAEAVRQSAVALTSWMQADWNNCECRSIHHSVCETSQLLIGQAAAAAGNAIACEGAATASEGAERDGDVQLGQFLWAWPGDPSTWWKGGVLGLCNP